MGDVVNLKAYREARDAEDKSYLEYLKSLDRLELLEEMVRFQEERSRHGELTMDMIVRGIPLFKALEEAAETHELRLLTRSYRRHLEYELEQRKKAQ